jgi:hypothetical protein
VIGYPSGYDAAAHGELPLILLGKDFPFEQGMWESEVGIRGLLQAGAKPGCSGGPVVRLDLA